MNKAIFINSKTREVKEVTLDESKVLAQTYDLIGNGCKLVESGMYLHGNDLLVVDEEGYFNKGLCGFYLFGHFFYGNGVVWGADDEGINSDYITPINEVVAGIVWADESQAEQHRISVMGN